MPSEKWVVVRLPALSEGESDPLGRPEGQSLWPERFNAQRLHKIRAQIGSVSWLAEYQQRPSAIEGGIFKRSWWASYDQLPRLVDIVFSADTAYKAGRTNDFSVINRYWRQSRTKLLPARHGSRPLRIP